jgi:hypothetical protein
MPEDWLRYDRMVESALRSVVRDALQQVAKRGLPGDHHFYISFRTTHPEVQISDKLRARFPEEMTIVLQYQFWGLEVDETGFAVTLSFNNQHERLSVPFTAVTTFGDPAVKFGLKFEAAAPAEQAAPKPAEAPAAAAGPQPAEAKEPVTPDPFEGEPKVVALDAFRKK